MTRSSTESNIKNAPVSPYIDKLLSDPLTFRAARYPDSVTIRPSSYITFGSAAASAGRRPRREKRRLEAQQRREEAHASRPKSVAEAVAQYSGKLSQKRSKIKRKQEIKQEPEQQQQDDDGDSDSENDDDFQTADEDSSDSEVTSSDEVDVDESSDSESEDVDTVKADLKRDMYVTDREEDTEESESDESSGDKGTPPTSPDEENAKNPAFILIPNDEFYDVNENDNDRGSNGSQRIYKSWREFKSRPSPVGLMNHGVTCYMNSAVQAMSHIPALMHYLVDVHYDRPQEYLKPNSVTKTLADTVSKMYGLDRNSDRKVSYLNPRRLIRRLQDINCMMSEWHQEDSHEYFMSLMGRLQEDSTPKGAKLNQSIIYDIFGGLLNQTVTCRNCGHISTTQQEFYDLSLGLENKRRRQSNLLNVKQMNQLKKQIESNGNKGADADNLSELLTKRIQDVKEEEQADRRRSNSPQPQQTSDEQETPPPVYSIENSIRYFFSPELIKADKKEKTGYQCEHCKKLTSAVKVSTIEQAPETLAVHLKRFRFNGTASMKVKSKVTYPEILDLTEYTTSMKSPTRYKLMAVIVHQGRSVSSGHYIAHCREPNGSWATYDDEYVNTIKAAEALNDPSAYVLLYSRMTHKEIEISKKTAPAKKRRSTTPQGTKKRRKR